MTSPAPSIENRPNSAYSIEIKDADATESIEESKETTPPVESSFLPPIDKPNKGLGMFKGLISDVANQ